MTEPTAARRSVVEQALRSATKQPLVAGFTNLLAALGYRSDRTTDLGSTPTDFSKNLQQFSKSLRQLDEGKAALTDWQACSLLFQITNDEIPPLMRGQQSLNIGGGLLGQQIESFVFIGIELKGEEWSRTALATITRELNRHFPMPAIVLFRHGGRFSLAVIDRRSNKRDASRDVLTDRISIIKDVRLDKPHTAHVHILAALAVDALGESNQRPESFTALYKAWLDVLSVQELNKRFYRELASWYFWALQEVRFPDGAKEDEKVRNATSVIRLITRLVFVWFIKERGLVSADLFELPALKRVLKQAPDAFPEDSTYYKSILQNLFFATLNMEMGDKRRFRGKNKSGGRDPHRGIHNVYRYEDAFQSPDAALRLFKEVPFLNGGLFECLDKFTKDENDQPKTVVRVDGFSDELHNTLKVPNKLFFSGAVDIDLNEIFATRNKRYTARGLLNILESYKFTVDENTPVEQEVALDPELLGKVFENLLASYNPETLTTARKQTGSFYTPREIVDYMVDESLFSNFSDALKLQSESIEESKASQLRALLSYVDTPHGFSKADTKKLIAAIDSIKVLDPACGSGAFPMGMLLKLVHVLGKLDPRNEEWKQRQVDRVNRLIADADETIQADDIKQAIVAGMTQQRADIEEAFLRNELDYGRKLYLIQNCIFGVDIQPIAVQISKLRFFISLIVDETIDAARPNRGIRPLPNLETKFVAANTLIDIDQPDQGRLSTREKEIAVIEIDLRRVRQKHFHARTQSTKDDCRTEDKALRRKLKELLLLDGFQPDTANKLADWDPYAAWVVAPFFDPRWMFEVADGFDVVIGNPPYLRVQGIQQSQPEFMPLYRERFDSAKGSFDLYALFIERGYKLLHKHGQLAYIVPHKFFQATFGVALRKLLTHRQALRQIVRFGAEQVFDEATTYTCLLFLGAKPQPQFDLLEVRSLAGDDDVLAAARTRTEHPDYAYGSQIAPQGDDWDFTLGESNKVMQRLRQHPRTLADITRKIFQGIATSADKIYVLKLVEDKGDVLRCYSKQLDAEIQIERGLVRPFLMGKDVHRYQPATPQNVVIFPYLIEGGKAQLLTQAEIRTQFPLGWKYLTENKAELEAREHGRFANNWWCFSRPQNMTEFLSVKVMTPDICARPEMSLDLNGDLYHTTTLYSFVFKPEIKESPLYFLGLLNSKVIWYFLTVTGNVLRGGYMRFKTEYLKPFPIPDSSPEHQTLIATLASYLLALKREAAEVDEPSSRHILMTAWFEQLIDALVYELYFPEEFAADDSRVSASLKTVALPETELLGNTPSSVLAKLFEITYAPEHPVRRAAYFSDSISAVRVIEGKA